MREVGVPISDADAKKPREVWEQIWFDRIANNSDDKPVHGQTLRKVRKNGEWFVFGQVEVSW